MNLFPNNARVCFLGDSITHNNEYVSRICAYYHDNFYERKVKFFNGGTSGGSINTIFANFDTDVIAHKPTHAVIMIGINDSWRTALSDIPRGIERYERLKTAYENYKRNVHKLCTMLKENEIEIILCTPTPYDEYQQFETPALKGGFALLEEYACFIRKYASENGIALCDYHEYISKISQIESVINADRVHPNSMGHYHMAKCFLAFQGVEIGEYAPVPSYLDGWKEVVLKLRNIRAAEHMVISDYSLSTNERIEKAKAYLESGGSGAHRDYFLLLAKQYLENKPVQDELEAKANALMDELYN